jgi:hypothetical protein
VSVLPPGPEPTTPAASPERLGRADWSVLGLAAWLLVVWAPNLYLGLLTPRMAAMLVALGPGLVVVAGLARRGDAGARWIGAFLAWALVSALLAARPRLALIGSYGTDTGWIWLAAFGAAWGLGRRLGPAARRALPVVLAVGVGANAAFALIEAVVEPIGDLAVADGRVIGLVSNPLFLAGLLSGGLAMAGRASATTGRWWWGAVALVLLCSTAMNLTGSRAPLVAGSVLAVGGAAVTVRGQADRRRGAVRVGLVAVAVVAGFALSLPLQSDASGASRLGDGVSSSSGVQSRTLAWGFGLDALAERPVVGWGPGRFREAVGPRTTAEFVRAEGPDKLFYDAHNLVVEHLVTTGVVGLLLLGGFALVAVRTARGPLAWFAAGVVVTWMLNPASVTTAPVALLALGAAWRPARGLAPVPSAPHRAGAVPVGRAVGGVLAGIGLVAGANLLVVDALVDRGTITGDVDTVELAQRLLPGDATITGLVTDAHVVVARSAEDPTGAERAAVASARRATREDPTRSTWWVRRGYAEGTFGTGSRPEQLEAAGRSFDEALERSPWSLEALVGQYNLAGLRGDAAAVARWRAQLCEIGQCPTAAPPSPEDDRPGG